MKTFKQLLEYLEDDREHYYSVKRALLDNEISQNEAEKIANIAAKRRSRRTKQVMQKALAGSEKAKRIAQRLVGTGELGSRSAARPAIHREVESWKERIRKHFE